jgi:isopentenyldiphosphate isomerase
MTPPLAQDPNEGFDVVAFDGEPTGIVKARAAVHRDGDWHRSIHVWVAGTDEYGPFLTFQRRAFAKDTWGGKLDATVGGHFRAGESLTETLREVEEEIGVTVSRADLKPLGVRVSVNDIGPAIRDHELQSIFLWLDDRPLLDFAPDPVELAALIRFPIEDLLAFFSTGSASIEGCSRAPLADRIETVVVGQDDFIPAIDRYFYRLAIAAGRAIRGEPHIAI